MFTMDGEEVAHTASLGEIDQLLDPFGKEILAVDQMGNVMEHGHIVGHVQPGPTGVEMTTASGADVAHIEESPVGMSVSSPTGAAILLLQNRFGV